MILPCSLDPLQTLKASLLCLTKLQLLACTSTLSRRKMCFVGFIVFNFLSLNSELQSFVAVGFGSWQSHRLHSWVLHISELTTPLSPSISQAPTFSSSVISEIVFLSRSVKVIHLLIFLMFINISQAHPFPLSWSSLRWCIGSLSWGKVNKCLLIPHRKPRTDPNKWFHSSLAW